MLASTSFMFKIKNAGSLISQDRIVVFLPSFQQTNKSMHQWTNESINKESTHLWIYISVNQSTCQYLSINLSFTCTHDTYICVYIYIHMTYDPITPMTITAKISPIWPADRPGEPPGSPAPWESWARWAPWAPPAPWTRCGSRSATCQLCVDSGTVKFHSERTGNMIRCICIYNIDYK